MRCQDVQAGDLAPRTGFGEGTSFGDYAIFDAMRGASSDLQQWHPQDVEKARIHVKEADELYREGRVANTLTHENGGKVGLKPGAEVDVVIEADSNATIKKPD